MNFTGIFCCSPTPVPAFKLMLPVYVPGDNPAGFTATETLAGVLPVGGWTLSHCGLPETCACAVNVKGAPVLETIVVRGSGPRAPTRKLNDSAVKLRVSPGGGSGGLTVSVSEEGVVE